MGLDDIGGLALAAEIKSDPDISAVRLILLASERNAADPVQRRAAGVAFQLVKPVREPDLYDCIVTPVRANEGVGTVALAGALAGALPAHLSPRPRQGLRPRALLAEDNPVNVEVASAMLRGLGMEVACAANGEEALAAVRAGDYDLVLMDCMMPVMDGMAATAEIRRLELQRGRARSTPIVAITANALQGDRERCLAAGMDDYISKPFSQKALADTLGRWVALPRPAGAIPPAARSADQETPPAAINPLALDAILALGTGQGESLLRRVLAAFLQDTPRQLTMLHEAIAKRDANAIRKAAHSLKSSSANVGADALAKLFKDMEQMGRSGNTGNAAGLLAQLEREFQSVLQSLSLIMAKGA
jgi:CheY-like chemotaxis protein